MDNESEHEAAFGPYVERRPVPDPTAATTASLLREISALQRESSSLRELLMAIINGLDSKFTTRLDGMDKALQLLQATNDQAPVAIDNKVKNLQALHNEKFDFIDQQIAMRFAELDKRIAQTSESSTTAINAAFQAAKEAVNQQNIAFAQATSKAELAQGKQMDQLGTLMTTTTASLNEKIDASTARAETAVSALRAELLPQITGERTRGDRGEGRQLGQGAMIGIIFGSIGAIGVLVTIVAVIFRFAPR